MYPSVDSSLFTEIHEIQTGLVLFRISEKMNSKSRDFHMDYDYI